MLNDNNTTRNYKTLLQSDQLLAEVYLDRRYYFLTIAEIAKLRGISVSKVNELLTESKKLLNTSDEHWLFGLSKRSKLALQRGGFNCKEEVRQKIDVLHKFDTVGDKIVSEVRRWLV